MKIKKARTGLLHLLRHLTRYKFRLVVIILLAVCSTVFHTVGPRILSLATNALADGAVGGTTIDFAYIGRVSAVLLAIYLLSCGFSALMGLSMSRLSTDVSYNLREELMAKINRIPVSYFSTHSHGDVLSRITNDVDTISQAMNQSVTQIITAICTILGVTLMMLSINLQMALAAICIVPVSLFVVAVIVKKSQRYFQGEQKYLGAVNGHVEEMYGGHLITTAFNSEQASINGLVTQNDKLYHASWRAEFLSGLMQPLITFIGNLGYVVVCMMGAIIAAGGTLRIGSIQAFIQYVRYFTQPLSQVANISNQLQLMAAATERVFEFLEKSEEGRPIPMMTTEQMNIQGDVHFHHLMFRYGNSDQTGALAINDVSAEACSGQKIAIVGPTGSGKTTIVMLLMRFYDLISGEILVDGNNIAEFDRQDLRREFGMVPQDTWLYHGSIMDNIRYGKLTATDGEVMEAAKAAQADHFIHTLPDGYRMEINEEATNLSNGQKQLLTIARAILSDSKILILDEATSSVDTRTEIQIQSAMDNLMHGRTSFIIAHRLSTIRGADMILCMENGSIVERGTHDELIAKRGFYANLYNSQFEKSDTPQMQAIDA